MKIILTILIVVLLLAWLKTGGTTARADYATAPFQLVRQEGKFELRDYPALVVVEAPMQGPNDSFMRLFRYIGGKNSTAEKIPMTTPVFMAGETTNATMEFVLPQKMGLDRAPAPAGADLRLREIVAGRFAVLRFSGNRKAVNENKALAKLGTWLAEQKLKTTDGPVFGYFDPPWTPSFLRRNEVMLRLMSAP